VVKVLRQIGLILLRALTSLTAFEVSRVVSDSHRRTKTCDYFTLMNAVQMLAILYPNIDAHEFFMRV